MISKQNFDKYWMLPLYLMPKKKNHIISCTRACPGGLMLRFMKQKNGKRNKISTDVYGMCIGNNLKCMKLLSISSKEEFHNEEELKSQIDQLANIIFTGGTHGTEISEAFSEDMYVYRIYSKEVGTVTIGMHNGICLEYGVDSFIFDEKCPDEWINLDSAKYSIFPNRGIVDIDIMKPENSEDSIILRTSYDEGYKQNPAGYNLYDDMSINETVALITINDDNSLTSKFSITKFMHNYDPKKIESFIARINGDKYYICNSGNPYIDFDISNCKYEYSSCLDLSNEDKIKVGMSNKIDDKVLNKVCVSCVFGKEHDLQLDYDNIMCAITLDTLSLSEQIKLLIKSIKHLVYDKVLANYINILDLPM